jgi:hypothetical protein
MPTTTGVLDLRRLTAETTVGYVFGGIVSQTLHSQGASRASSVFIPVLVSPESSSADPMPPAPPRG